MTEQEIYSEYVRCNAQDVEDAVLMMNNKETFQNTLSYRMFEVSYHANVWGRALVDQFKKGVSKNR